MFQEIVRTDNAQKIPIAQDAWTFFQFEDLEIVRLDLGPGESMAPHENPWRIVFYLLGGSGSLEVEGSAYPLAAGDSIAVEAGKVRAWTNSGASKLELLVIKSKARP